MSDTSVSTLLRSGQERAPAAVHGAPAPDARWLLLTHHLPAKPGYLRVKVGRRLERMGAVALKNSVYVLPAGEDTLEDFQWLRREIAESGGEASICLASFVDDETDARLAEEFERARNADYRQIINAADKLRDAAGSDADDVAASADLRWRVASLRDRLAAVRALDFFGASEQGRADAAVRSLDVALRPGGPGAGASPSAAGPLKGRTWVTRQGVKVDRISSAWLIRRFIDPEAVFKFVTAGAYEAEPRELRFDMFGGEFTHVGDTCTFETLLRRFGLDDAALVALGEIIHDIDLKDDRFGRPEVAGIASVIEGITAAASDDAERIRRGTEVLDVLYHRFASRP